MVKKTIILNPTGAYPDGFSYNLPKDIPSGEIIVHVGWDKRLFLNYEEKDSPFMEQPQCSICGVEFHNTVWHEKYYDKLFRS